MATSLSSACESVTSLLKTATVAELLAGQTSEARPLVSVWDSATVGDALNCLKTGAVLSAPVAMRTASGVTITHAVSVHDLVVAFVSQDTVPPELPVLQRMAQLSSLGVAFGASPVLALPISDDCAFFFLFFCSYVF